MTKIYVITTGNKERMDRVSLYFEDIDFEFVYSDTLDELEKLEKKYKRLSHQFRQKAIMAGEIGCFKTHTTVWDKIIEAGEPGIVIEDNIEFTDSPSLLLSEEFNDAIQAYGLLCFTDYSYKPYPDKPFLISSIDEKKLFPTVCYGLVPERAKNLKSNFNKRPFVMPIDKWMATPKLAGCYGFINHIRIARRKENLSSIANKKKGKKTMNPLNIIRWGINKFKYKY